MSFSRSAAKYRTGNPMSLFPHILQITDWHLSVQLLLHHVIPGAFELSSLQDEMTGVSLAGTQLRVNTYTSQDVEWNDVKVSPHYTLIQGSTERLPNFRRLLIGLFGVKNIIQTTVRFSVIKETPVKI
jgi:hypothetical protein